MSGEIDIYNVAAVAIDQEPLTSPDQQNKLGRLCRARYVACRRFVLRGFPWNCARGRVQVGADPTAPVFGYANQYLLPADFLRVISVNNNLNANWRVEGLVNAAGVPIGQGLLTDEGAPLQLIYIRDLVDVTRMDPMLVRAIGYDLGAEIAMAMTGEIAKRDRALTALAEVLAAAKGAAAQENSSDEWDVDIWLQNRL